jgi:hypothetical protein
MFCDAPTGKTASAITFAWGPPVARAAPCFNHARMGGGEAYAPRDSAWKGRPL